MESIETESNTRFAQNYIDSFFTKLPYDSRFNKVEYQKFVPISGMGETVRQIDFVLERRDAPMCYLISDILVEVHVTILEDTPIPTLPATSTEVGPVNNALHSLFQKVTVKINGTQITDTPELYNYKSYLQTLLTYDSDVKNCNLDTVGWITDLKRHMETEMQAAPLNQPKNVGWWNRCNRFKKDGLPGAEYRKDGATFIGRLNHELTQSSKPLPPQMLVQISLNLASHDFYIMKKKGDPKNYKAVVTYCCLYVPIAFMQMEMLRELELRWPKEPISYHYRRHNILKLSVHRNKKEYFSDALFAESENPIRIFFFLVQTDAAIGTQESNPYNFGRTWTYNKDVPRLSLEDQLEEKHTQTEIGTLKNMMMMIMGKLEDMKTTPTPTPENFEEEEPLARKSAKGSPIKSRSTRSAAVNNAHLPSPTAETSGTAAGAAAAAGTSTSFISSVANIFRRNSQTPLEVDEFEILAAAETIKRNRIARGADPASSGGGRSTQSVHELNAAELDNYSIISDHLQRLRANTVSKFWLEKLQLELNSQPLGYYLF